MEEVFPGIFQSLWVLTVLMISFLASTVTTSFVSHLYKFEFFLYLMLNINLKNNEVKFLTNFIKKGMKNARSLTRARILLLANQGKGDTEIAKT